MYKNKTKRNAIIWTIFAIAYCFITRLVDVGVAGETQTEVGCVTINEKFYELLGTFNPIAYKISEILGYLMILICALYGLMGLIQWIKRKNMLKVDPEILCTGVLFSVTIGLYVLFNEVAVTYRPIIVPGEDALEASFPSSHSMLAFVVMGATTLIIEKYISNKTLRTIATILIIVSAIAIPVLRLISGVHWVTDIMAGAFIAIMLLHWYGVALAKFCTEDAVAGQVQGKHFKK